MGVLMRTILMTVTTLTLKIMKTTSHLYMLKRTEICKMLLAITYRKSLVHSSSVEQQRNESDQFNGGHFDEGMLENEAEDKNGVLVFTVLIAVTPTLKIMETTTHFYR